MARSLFAVALLAACADGATDGFDTASACGTSAPVLSDLTITVGETTVTLAATATDADGDLHEYTSWVFVDDVPDDTLPERPAFQTPVPVSDKVCGVNTVSNAGAIVPVGGNGAPAGTDVEFGLVVFDAAGNPSNGGVPLIQVVRTPTEL